MQNQAHRMQWAIIRVALRVVGVAALCFAALSFLAFHSAAPTHAANRSFHPLVSAAGATTSSPTSGPAGTTITVSGSGYAEPNTATVQFGYLVGSTTCHTVSNSINFLNGGFSGSFNWPSGTAVNNPYRVCALFSDHTIATAQSFTPLSSNPPGVMISPGAFNANQQVTVIASNFYPAGTKVSFQLTDSNNTPIGAPPSVPSNTSGVATTYFTAASPYQFAASGTYYIEAYVGIPPTQSAKTFFTYTAPGVQPSPTPSPGTTPTPSLTPTQNPTPGTTPTAQASATATTGATPTVSTTSTVSTTPTVGQNQTPAPGSTSGNNGSGGAGSNNSSGSSNPLLLVAGIVGLLTIILAGLVLALIIARRRKAAQQQSQAIPPRLPDNPGMIPWANPQGVFANNGAMPPNMNNGMMANPNAGAFQPYAPNSRPGMVGPQVNNGNGQSMANVPMPLAVPASPGNGNGMQPPPAQQSPTWQTTTSPDGVAAGVGGNRTMVAPNDPSLEAMRRQAQSGLFVVPRPFNDEQNT